MVSLGTYRFNLKEIIIVWILATFWLTLFFFLFTTLLYYFLMPELLIPFLFNAYQNCFNIIFCLGMSALVQIIKIHTKSDHLPVSRPTAVGLFALDIAHRLARDPNAQILDLRQNHLYSIPCDELKIAFSGLKDTPIRKINLSGNRLGQKSMNDLEEIFSSIPDTVTDLDLRNNGFVYLQPQDQELLVNMLIKTGSNILIEESIVQMLREYRRLPLLFKIADSSNMANDPLLDSNALKVIFEYTGSEHSSTPRPSS